MKIRSALSFALKYRILMSLTTLPMKRSRMKFAMAKALKARIIVTLRNNFTSPQQREEKGSSTPASFPPHLNPPYPITLCPHPLPAPLAQTESKEPKTIASLSCVKSPNHVWKPIDELEDVEDVA